MDNNPTQTHPDNNQVLPQAIPLKKHRKRREKPVDKQLVAAMLADGYRKPIIAEQAECTLQTVYDVKNLIETNKIPIEDFLKNRANLLALEQKERIELSRKLRQSIALDLEGGLLKGSEKGKIVFYLDQGFGIFFDKERLETGKSTQNTAILQAFILNAHEKL